jgi:hypothetical protein
MLRTPRVRSTPDPGLRSTRGRRVGKHWTVVRPVKDADLTAEDRAAAAGTRDARIP